MKSKLGDKERLGHILDSISFIEKALHNVEENKFQSDFILHTAVQRWLEIIGEATYKLTRAFKSNHPEVQWRQIEDLRHVLVHEYLGIDLLRIWKITQKDVPVLKSAITNLLTEFE